MNKKLVLLSLAAAIAPVAASAPASACVLEADGVVYDIADWDPACSLNDAQLAELNTTVVVPRADDYYVQTGDGGVVYGPSGVADGNVNPEGNPETFTTMPQQATVQGEPPAEPEIRSWPIEVL